MNCPKCNYLMSDLDKECQRCHGLAMGAPPALGPVAPVPHITAASTTANALSCKRCATAAPPNSYYCPNCGDLLFSVPAYQILTLEYWTQWQPFWQNKHVRRKFYAPIIQRITDLLIYGVLIYCLLPMGFRMLNNFYQKGYAQAKIDMQNTMLNGVPMPDPPPNPLRTSP